MSKMIYAHTPPYTNETVEFDITVSKGTYIRSIVDDMGQYLDTKAIVKELNRTAVGNLKSTNKNLITNVENLKSLDPVPVLNWSEVLDLPSVVLDINQENHIRNGQLLENKYFKTSNKHLIIIDDQIKAVYQPFNEKYFITEQQNQNIEVQRIDLFAIESF